MKILCADDSKITLKMLQDLVEALGYEFLGTTNGEEAIRRVKEQHEEIALALLDWNIPPPDGLKVLQWLKDSESYRHIPVIMVTAMGHKDKVDQALQAGASHYVTKPFEAEDLAAKIRQCLKDRDEVIDA